MLHLMVGTGACHPWMAPFYPWMTSTIDEFPPTDERFDMFA